MIGIEANARAIAKWRTAAMVSEAGRVGLADMGVSFARGAGRPVAVSASRFMPVPSRAALTAH
ncbi:hypothetical protein GCM10010403_28140 [Glycomyces rutgersensis]|uniref:Uncharacterized protein n=1 Tax=Glycomyces rutgersensis TaxID=58115 RepID=A0ABN3FPN4_9ACTN